MGVDANAPKLENRTLWQRVHDHLRTEIRAGRLLPGAELNEVALSQELGVSRGPIREALGRLAAEGLVTIRPRRGAVVRALSGDEFAEAYQVREALEVMAVRLAVPRLSQEDVRRLGDLTELMRARAGVDDLAGFFEANRAFHLVFFEAAGNRMLSEIYHQVCGQIDRYRMRSVQLRGNLHRSIAEHRAIVRAAKSGDVERTARLVGEHIRVPRMRLRAEESVA
jgi:DNA-binding GntR family transcriptional regulator